MVGWLIDWLLNWLLDSLIDLGMFGGHSTVRRGCYGKLKKGED